MNSGSAFEHGVCIILAFSKFMFFYKIFADGYFISSVNLDAIAKAHSLCSLVVCNTIFTDFPLI